MDIGTLGREVGLFRSGQSSLVAFVKVACSLHNLIVYDVYRIYRGLVVGVRVPGGDEVFEVLKFVKFWKSKNS